MVTSSFSVNRRNWGGHGHWDIYGKDGRMFRIRGGPGKYSVYDERLERPIGPKSFKTVIACMNYICDELMFELIVADGQTATIIESWNI